jgi:hypothetical protein
LLDVATNGEYGSWQSSCCMIISVCSFIGYWERTIFY